ADLDDKCFTVRDKAFAELAKVADRHEATLRKMSEQTESAEARRQLQRLLECAASPSSERLRQLRAVELLERIGTPQAVALLRELAAGADGAALTFDAQATLRRMH